MTRTACISLFAVLLGTGASVARATEPVSPEAIDALRAFVLTDCELGEETSSLDALREHAGPLVPELERMLTDGPDPTLLAEATSAMEQRWEDRQAFLESAPRLGLDPEALLAVTTLSHDAYIEREQRRFDLTCREKAAIGLAGIGSPSAWRALRRASEQGDPALRETVLQILDRSRPTERGRARVRQGRSAN
jgi:hypothetical protein